MTIAEAKRRIIATAVVRIDTDRRTAESNTMRGKILRIILHFFDLVNFIIFSPGNGNNNVLVTYKDEPKVRRVEGPPPETPKGTNSTTDEHHEPDYINVNVLKNQFAREPPGLRLFPAQNVIGYASTRAILELYANPRASFMRDSNSPCKMVNPKTLSTQNLFDLRNFNNNHSGKRSISSFDVRRNNQMHHPNKEAAIYSNVNSQLEVMGECTQNQIIIDERLLREYWIERQIRMFHIQQNR